MNVEKLSENNTKMYEKHLKALIEDQKYLYNIEQVETPNEISFSSVFTDGFAKIQKQTQDKIDLCEKQKVRLETENLKLIEKIEKEFRQHVKDIAAKDGLVVGDK